MKRFVRSVLTTILFGVFGFGACIMNFLIFPAAKIVLEEKKFIIFCSDFIYHIWKFFIRLLMLLRIIKLDIKNKEEIANIRNKIIVSTHPSFIDIVILMSLIPRTTCFAKRSLAQNPLLKNIIKSIFITDDVEIEELKFATKKMLDMGFNVIIFPAGTRHRRGEFPKIKKGAALAAINAGKNIIPIKMYTSEDFLFINQPFYAAGGDTVIFEIISVGEIDISDFQSETEIAGKKHITDRIKQALYDVK